MASCNLCGAEVTSHRYLRAEPMYEEPRPDGKGVKVAPVQLKVTKFYCLTHPRGEMEADILREYPPSASLPVRLLWSPAPGVKLQHRFEEPQLVASIEMLAQGLPLPELGAAPKCARCGEPEDATPHVIWRQKRAGFGVIEARTTDGNHQARTITVRDPASLHFAFDELIPPGTKWLIAHTGEVTLDAAKDILLKAFGGDDEQSEAIREQIARLGT